MLNIFIQKIEKSFFFQHWEILVIVISIVFFALRLKDRYRSSNSSTRQINDDEIIANDEKSDEINADDLTSSLENIDHVPFRGPTEVLKGGAKEFFNIANDRRSIRKFSKKPVHIEVVKKCIHAAGTGPSGAHTEPWTFCLVKR